MSLSVLLLNITMSLLITVAAVPMVSYILRRRDSVGDVQRVHR